MRALTCIAVALLSAAAVPAQDPVPDFAREVRPLLARHCFACHGPDEAARQGGLRLDERAAALRPAKSGRAAVVPGEPAASELVRRITAADEDERMPPPSAHRPLTAADREVLVRWIAAGAEYRPHWAFVPPVQSELPATTASHWPRNPIDHFVLAAIERAGLQPAPEADRWTLVRRVHLDLIGLPPTPEVAQAFVDDPAPDAYERLVDRLLALPQYGERWARRWLDLARYADTNGYEKDRERSIWPWRDQVVRAFNDDQPFDQFTIEQLAGDLLPGASPEQITATGFHRNTMLNEEGGIDPLEFRYHAMADRVATTGTAWLGLSLGCAQCHTHKFDPITQRDYFAVMACLDNADDVEMQLPEAGAATREAAAAAQAEASLSALPDHFPIEPAWQVVERCAVTVEGAGAPERLADGSLRFPAPGEKHVTYTIAFESPLAEVSTLRLEVLTDRDLPQQGPGHATNGNFVLSGLRVAAASCGSEHAPQPVAIAVARADAEQDGFPVAHCLDDATRGGWAVDVGDSRRNKAHTAVFEFAKPVVNATGSRFVVTLQQRHGNRHTIGRLRLAVGALPAPGEALVAARRAACQQAGASWRAAAAAGAVPWTVLRPLAVASNLPGLEVQADDSVFASGDITKSDTYTLRCAVPPAGITALRLEVLPDARLPGGGPGLAYYEGPAGDFFLGEFELYADRRRLAFARASESHGHNAFGDQATAMLAIDGDLQTGWSTADRPGERHTAVFVLSEPLTGSGELEVRMTFGRHYACSLGRFRLAATAQQGGVAANALPAEVEAALLPSAEATADEVVFAHFLRTTPALATARQQLQIDRERPAVRTTLVLRERSAGNPRTTWLRRRGEYLQPVAAIAPGVLETIAPLPPGVPRNRLGLARWIVDPSNPLTARVAVNRAWQAFFGHGIVRSLGDFGYQGDLPTHPELLDWLAVEFVRRGWSHKQLHRLIATSATYRQTGMVAAELRERDPDNRLLARGPRVRLEAEVLRDSVLQASGLLSLRMGGPGVRPPQPAGVTEIGFGKPSWQASPGEDRYRRSLYTFHKRTTPFALLQTFDAPSGEACVVRRETASTPLQALTLLNDVLVVDAARALGALLVARPATDLERLQAASLRCLSRPLDDQETAVLLAFVTAQRARLVAGELDAASIAGAGDGDRRELAVWALLARVLFNLDEFVTRR
jgi:hypothetical protein